MRTEPRRETVDDRIFRRRQTILYTWVSRVMTAGFWASVGFVALGLFVAVVRGQPVGDEVDPLDQVIPDALGLNAQGIVDLGLLTLLATPAATVVVSLVIALRQRDRFFVSVCVCLLLIFLGSVAVSLR